MKIKNILTCLLIFVFCLSLSDIRVFGKNGVGVVCAKGGEWYYYDMGDYASVCEYTGYDEHVTIPEILDGKPVAEISYNGGVSLNGAEIENCFFRSQTVDVDGGEPTQKTKHVTIPSTVKRIDDYAFYGCLELEQVDLPEGLIAIGDNAFSHCYNLTSAELPKSLKKIGKNAFALSKITLWSGLPEGLDYIGSSAFLATKIKSVEIPDTVHYIGRYAFANCPLEYARLPSGITEVPTRLFEDCMGLKKIEIPEGIKVISEGALGGCESLEEIYFPSTAVTLSEILVKNTSLKDIYFAADRETVEAVTGTNVLEELMVDYDNDTDYSGVQIHYGEKKPDAAAAEDTEKPKQTLRIIFTVTAILFAAAFLAALCLFLAQKIKNLPPKPLPQQGNALTGLHYSEKKCSHCGAESGEIALYCYNCGKKLKGR